jgi:hypothetical protein
MPGSVQKAAPATVMPPSLSRAFAHERSYPLIENEYQNIASLLQIDSDILP